MKFSVRSLASGSSGNAILVRTDKTAILIDCGLSLLRLKKFLLMEGLSPGDLGAVVLTHEHTDHTCGVEALAARHGTAIYATPGTLEATLMLANLASARPIAYGSTVELHDLHIALFPVPHDAAEPAGVTVFHSGTRKKISVVTDAGRVTASLRDALRGSDLIVLESNHDVDRLIAGRYPARLKARIRGGRGHLSNEECAHLIADLAAGHPGLTVWLAHLSKENNTPALALGHTRAVLAKARRTNVRLDFARRDRPSVHWSPELNYVQLQLALTI